MQRTANPSTPVRFRPQPPIDLILALEKYNKIKIQFSPGGGIGRHKGLKIPR